LNNHALTSYSYQYTLADRVVHNLSFQQEVTQLLNMHGLAVFCSHKLNID